MSASCPRVQQHLALLQGALDAVAGEPPKEAGCTGRIDHPIIGWSPNWYTHWELWSYFQLHLRMSAQMAGPVKLP